MAALGFHGSNTGSASRSITSRGGVVISTLGIVFLSIFGGLFLAVILATSAWLIYVSLEFRRTLPKFQAALDKSLTDARADFAAHHTAIDTAVNRINVTSFEKSAGMANGAARRIEQCAVAFGELVRTMVSEQTLTTSAANLEAEEYAKAEPGEKFVDYSSTGRADRFDENDESQETILRQDF